MKVFMIRKPVRTASRTGRRAYEEGAMIGNAHFRAGFSLLALLTALALPGFAMGSHGGGGGGGTPAPRPTGASAVTFAPTSLTFAAQAIGATSAPQSITVTNTGTAPLFINSAVTRAARTRWTSLK